MAADTCPHCGRPLGSQTIASRHANDELAVVPEGGAPEPPLPVVPDITAGTVPEPDRSAGRTSRLRFAALAVAAALVGVVVGSLLFRSDDPPVVADPEAPDDVAADLAAAPVEGQGDAGEVPEPLDSVAELFRDWVDRDRSWAVVYPSPMGLQVLSAAGTAVPEIEVAVGFEEAARFPLVSDGSTSWAIDPGGLDTAYLVSTQFVVVDVDREGRVAFINDSLDPPNIGESSFGAWGPGFDLPPGADVLAVPGRGLFVLPETGGTFQYELNGVVPFSDDVLVAASVDSEVLQRCDETLACELYLEAPSVDGQLALGIDVESELWPSPGGGWLVVREPGGESWLRDVASGVDQPIAGVVRAADWAEDGSMVAVLTRDDLIVMRPESEEARSVTLPIAPSANTVLLVTE